MVLLGATLMPLALEVLWRTDTGGTAHVQPEVAVVERSGEAFINGRDPYRFIKPHQKVSVPAGEPSYDVYNPYLPLMSLFGGPRSTDAPPRLTDARVAFSVFTILIVVIAMALCRGPTGPRVLALQSMTVLPTAALPLATGGDDLPVAALLLLGLVLLQRRRPLWAGVALGVAASMKITAWPLAALAFLVARDTNGERGRRPSLAVVVGIVGVMIPAVLPTATENMSRLHRERGPVPARTGRGAAPRRRAPSSAIWWCRCSPGSTALFTVAVAVVGLGVLGYVLVKRRPTSPAALARLVGWIMTVAILLAPATRVGYLLYPVDFFVWAWLLRGEDTVDPLPERSRPERRAVAVGAPASGEDGDDPDDGAAGGGWGTGGDRHPSARTDRARRAPPPGGGRSGAGCSRRPATGMGSVLVRHRVQPSVNEVVPGDAVAEVPWAPKKVGATVTPRSHSRPSLAGCCSRIRYSRAGGAGRSLTEPRQCRAGSSARKNEITSCWVAGTSKRSDRS